VAKSEPAITAEDDEPEFVREFNRRLLKRFFLTIIVYVAINVAGEQLFSSSVLSSALFYLTFLVYVPFILWFRRSFPPVRAWGEEWLKKHRVTTKEDTH
jgi:hypothetical protein